LNGKCVLTTSFNHRATEANGFRNIFAISTTWAALTIWMKEHFARQLTAGTVLLPIPVFYNWLWETRNFAHFYPLDT
jgi:hypothetical protein